LGSRAAGFFAGCCCCSGAVRDTGTVPGSEGDTGTVSGSADGRARLDCGCATGAGAASVHLRFRKLACCATPMPGTTPATLFGALKPHTPRGRYGTGVPLHWRSHGFR